MALKIIGPERYDLAVRPDGYSVRCIKGTSKFSGLATRLIPKMYVVGVDEWPDYVGITTRRLSERLRCGWRAKGERGYHGYRWRHSISEANIDIWGQEELARVQGEILDIEVVEAEVVFLIRQTGPWPVYQTEIHFHQPDDEHRKWASDILGHYRRT
jgi:hypothetical protein